MTFAWLITIHARELAKNDFIIRAQAWIFVYFFRLSTRHSLFVATRCGQYAQYIYTAKSFILNCACDIKEFLHTEKSRLARIKKLCLRASHGWICLFKQVSLVLAHQEWGLFSLVCCCRPQMESTFIDNKKKNDKTDNGQYSVCGICVCI